MISLYNLFTGLIFSTLLPLLFKNNLFRESKSTVVTEELILFNFFISYHTRNELTNTSHGYSQYCKTTLAIQFVFFSITC